MNETENNKTFIYGNKAFIYGGGPVEWAVAVPVADSEMRRATATYAHEGSEFTTARLRAEPGFTRGTARYTLSGPYTRKDGTQGARTLHCGITREELEAAYPATLEAVKAALRELAVKIADYARDAGADIDLVAEGNGAAPFRGV